MKFKVGDRIKRVSGEIGDRLKIGDIGIIKAILIGTNSYRVINERTREVQTWGDDYIDIEPSQTIVIYPKGLETIALLKEGKKVIKQASAKCNPSDKYDFNIGAKLAFDRLMGRVEQSRPNTIIKQDKYEVGDKVRFRSDLKANTRYGGVELSPCMLNFAKGDVTIDKIWDESNYFIKDCGFIWNEEMFEGKVIDAPSVREVKRPAKIGEWIRVTSESGHDNGKGIFEVTRLGPNNDGWVYVNGQTRNIIRIDQYVVLENYQPEETAKILAVYTDKELINELSRRWEDKQ